MKTQSLMMFYKGGKLSTLSANNAHHTILTANNYNLCEASSQSPELRLLAVDLQNSTLRSISNAFSPVSYCPFGQDNLTNDSPLLSRFTGQYYLPNATAYFLGNGYRVFSPTLMRFYSPDNVSPFGNGGINAYAYCSNDPINNTDPSGHLLVRQYKKFRGIHRDQLYPKLDDMLLQRNNRALPNKKNTLGKRKYKALKKLVHRDNSESKKRLTYAEDLKSEWNKEVFDNNQKYSEEEINTFYSILNTEIEAAGKVNDHDLRTQNFVNQMKPTIVGGKKRYHLPPEKNKTTRQGEQANIFEQRRAYYSNVK